MRPKIRMRPCTAPPRIASSTNKSSPSFPMMRRRPTSTSRAAFRDPCGAFGSTDRIQFISATPPIAGSPTCCSSTTSSCEVTDAVQFLFVSAGARYRRAFVLAYAGAIQARLCIAAELCLLRHQERRLPHPADDPVRNRLLVGRPDPGWRIGCEPCPLAWNRLDHPHSRRFQVRTLCHRKCRGHLSLVGLEHPKSSVGHRAALGYFLLLVRGHQLSIGYPAGPGQVRQFWRPGLVYHVLAAPRRRTHRTDARVDAAVELRQAVREPVRLPGSRSAVARVGAEKPDRQHHRRLG